MSGQPITDAVVRDVLEARARGETYPAIARRLGRATPKGIVNKIDRLRLEGVWTVADWDRRMAAQAEREAAELAEAARRRAALAQEPEASPPPPAPNGAFSEAQDRLALRLKAEGLTLGCIGERVGRTQKAVENRLRLLKLKGILKVEDYDEVANGGSVRDRPGRQRRKAHPPAHLLPPQPQASTQAHAKRPERAHWQVGPTVIGWRHADAEQQHAERRRAQAHAQRMEKARPQSEEELRAAIERHIAEKGVTRLETKGQHDFSLPWERFTSR